MTTKDQDNLEIASPKPKLHLLKSEIADLATRAGYHYDRASRWYDVRYCLWGGQSDDGRKWAEDGDGDIFPWPGASDTRVRLADKLIKERKRLRKLALFGKKVKARGLNAADMDWAATVNPLLTWMLYTHCLPMMKRESNLVSSYMDTTGAAVVGVFWERETRLELKTVTLEALAAAAQQSGDPNARRMLDEISDPLRDDQTVEMLQAMIPSLKAGGARKFLEKLRLTGSADLKTPYIFRNRPKWVAMRPFIDVFFNGAIDDLQRDRLIVYRELVSEAELRDRETTDGYDPEFIEAAVQQKGQSTFLAMDPLFGRGAGLTTRGSQVEEMENRIELLHAYYRVYDGDASAIHCTILHNDVAELCAKHEALGYEHEEMPFHAFQCEQEERAIMESRGVCEIVHTWQAEKKIQRDARVDRTAMEILPALIVPKGMAGMVEFGPAQQIEDSRKGEYRFLQPNPLQPTTKVVESDIDTECNEFFGRMGPGSDPQMVMAARQELVAEWLADWIPPIRQTFQNMQQFMTDEEVSRIVGHLRHPFHVGREDIQGQFELEFTFDARNLDIEFIQTTINMIKEIAAFDRLGEMDMSALVKVLVGAIDPNIAEAIMRPASVAQMQEVDDQQSRLAKIAVGMEPPQKQFANPKLRMEVTMNAIQSNKQWQERLQKDETFKKLMENEVKMMQFGIAQSVTNPQIGRTGVKPVLGGDGSGVPQLGMSRLEHSVEQAGMGGGR